MLAENGADIAEVPSGAESPEVTYVGTSRAGIELSVAVEDANKGGGGGGAADV